MTLGAAFGPQKLASMTRPKWHEGSDRSWKNGWAVVAGDELR